MALLPLYLTFIIASGQYNYSWSKHSDPPLPVGNRLYAVAQYNETIWLVGGGQAKGFVSFDVIDETFTNLDPFGIHAAWGWGDYSAQIGHTMYYIYPSAPRLHTFDCRTATTTSWLSTPWDVDYNGCLAADVANNRLFIVGGGFNTALKNVTFLNLATSNWTTAPLMNWARRQHSCIVDPITSKLFAIGSNDATTIEYIDVNTLDQWVLNAEVLTTSTTTFYQSRAVIHPLTALIYVIGGRTTSSPNSIRYFFSIDPVTGKVIKNDISYALELGMGVAVFGDTIYSFGGGTSPISTAWFTMKILTSDPTMATREPSTSLTMNTFQPTKYPSNIPSFTPSSTPSFIPSTLPSGAPSYVPTIQPTVFPTTGPSKPSSNPSANPSSNPTANPTANPSNTPSKQSSNPTTNPTANPSSNPSVNPSKNPSSNPTGNPTANPSSNPSAKPSSNPTYQSNTSTTFPGFSSTWLDDSSLKTETPLFEMVIAASVSVSAVFCIIILYLFYRIVQKKKAHDATDMMSADLASAPVVHISKWTADDVYGYLSTVNDGTLIDLAKLLKSEDVRGRALVRIMDDDLLRMGVSLGHRMEFREVRNELVKQFEAREEQDDAILDTVTCNGGNVVLADDEFVIEEDDAVFVTTK